MDSDVFKSLVGFYNCEWLSNRLLIKRGESNSGIDLVDDPYFLGIELKSKDRHFNPRNFAVDNRQVRQYPRQNPGHILYWAFMIYSSQKRPEELKPEDRLQGLLQDREVWFLPWEWIRRFQIHSCKTADYRYPSLRSFPKNNYFRTQQVESGTFHMPKGMAIDKRMKDLSNASKRRKLEGLMDVPF